MNNDQQSPNSSSKSGAKPVLRHQASLINPPPGGIRTSSMNNGNVASEVILGFETAGEGSGLGAVGDAKGGRHQGEMLKHQQDLDKVIEDLDKKLNRVLAK